MPVHDFDTLNCGIHPIQLDDLRTVLKRFGLTIYQCPLGNPEVFLSRRKLTQKQLRILAKQQAKGGKLCNEPIEHRLFIAEQEEIRAKRKTKGQCLHPEKKWKIGPEVELAFGSTNVYICTQCGDWCVTPHYGYNGWTSEPFPYVNDH